ncbi:MAG: DUF1156 domain-containing protein [Chlorobi bacterium]|nr:DUF1156 domain-containing protein [Chlorobiota bacterium]
MSRRKKLIEVALPLEAINAAAVREKSIRHGHPSTLHLWWARRPLAAARAVIFAQLVDDPSANPDLFPTEHEQQQERDRLFGIIQDLVQWENTTNPQVLAAARAEIWQSWRRTCAHNAQHPRAAELFNPANLPPFHDPFAGGGALPLEAQRLGLESHASDLNPVAVLINKAMIEIPTTFAGMPPANPEARKDHHHLFAQQWNAAQGLAHDVRHYGQWMREQAEQRIGHLYPTIHVTHAMVADRPDLQPYLGRQLTPIAWLWARTVKSPNPAFSHIHVPLVSSFFLSTKPGKEAYVQPVVDGDSYHFRVHAGKPDNPEITKNGTKSAGSGSNFLCLMSGTPIPFEFIRAEAKNGNMGARLMAVVAEGDRGRVYLAPTQEMEERIRHAHPKDVPDTPLPAKALGFRVQEYGMTRWRDLFTPRQLVALTTFSDLVAEARTQIERDAAAAGMPNDPRGLDTGGTGAKAYAEAVSIYLSFLVSQLANHGSSMCGWHSANTQMRNVFARQAIPMVWDYAESNPFCDSSGSFNNLFERQVQGFEALGEGMPGKGHQADAARQAISSGKIISTDPPYYDNIGYADLSDFFYVWLRRSLRGVFPGLLATLTVPKTEELVATPYRHGTKKKAEEFFLDGMTEVMEQLAKQAHPAFPVTIYYAFKQSENQGTGGVASTGWETFLDAVIRSGFTISGTWPVRTEMKNRQVAMGTNALASSIVLVCRKRPAEAGAATRREFLEVLKRELPLALRHFQGSNIAPVDLAQGAIGPGMAIYTRYSKVLDADGKALTVREALAMINQTLDEALAEQEGAFDADSRWALAWFEQQGFGEGEYGIAETLSTAKNTSIRGMVEAGIVASKGGKVRLLRPTEFPSNWDPATDQRLPAWEVVHRLVGVLESGGEPAAAELVAALGARAEAARELAYRLYTICERKKRAAEGGWYNGLVQSWPEVARLARQAPPQAAGVQESFL